MYKLTVYPSNYYHSATWLKDPITHQFFDLDKIYNQIMQDNKQTAIEDYSKLVIKNS